MDGKVDRPPPLPPFVMAGYDVMDSLDEDEECRDGRREETGADGTECRRFRSKSILSIPILSATSAVEVGDQ